MTPRLLAALFSLLFGCTALRAQAVASGFEGGGDTALVYQFVHSNTQPGKCGCFNATGAGLSASAQVTDRWAGVLEADTEFASNGPGTGNSLTLISALAGARYLFPPQFAGSAHPLRPFGQVLVGIARAGGGIAGAGDGTYALAGHLGAGLDVPLSGSLGIRLLDIEYYPTEFANGTNNRQNNVLVGIGAIYHWSAAR